MQQKNAYKCKIFYREAQATQSEIVEPVSVSLPSSSQGDYAETSHRGKHMSR
jgi:hypothetical protein